MALLSTIVLMTLAYIAGSINTSILLFRWMGFEDPRTRFSGNAGVTNVYRQAGPAWAAVVLLADVGKAALIAFLSVRFLPRDAVPLSGLALITGNRFPCFHGFKGGKGVAAYIGFTAVISPVFTLTALGLWVLAYSLSKTPFIASLAAILCLSAGLAHFTGLHAVPMAGVLGITGFLVFNHRKNISDYFGADGKRSE